MVDKKYTWATEDIYKSVEEWEQSYKNVESMLDFSDFQGKLGDPQVFYKFTEKDALVNREIGKLSVYAMMKHDENTKISLYYSLAAKISSLCSIYGSKVAFVRPELTALDKEVLVSYINNPLLKDYSYQLTCILKEKAHVLSDSEEKLLAEGGEVFSCFSDIFGKIDNADLPLGKIRHNGKTIKLTHGTYSVLLQNPDRKLREKAFKKYYQSYISLINTISSTYYGNVKKNVFLAKARKYDSVLQKALAGEDVSEKVYNNLLTSVNQALPLLHRYIAEKKKLLKLNEMHMFDMYVPVVEGVDLKLEYDKAYDLVVKGLEPLGKEYCDLLEKARCERWIDVYEGEGKRSGAYSVAVYDTHPYVLLNYQQTTHDVFTIAHEMGHSLHSYFSNKNQPYAKADYTIFVAEVASTVNEVLLIKYLLKTATEKKLRKYLLSYLLEMIRTTLFRQTQFSEIESFAHALVEKGEPLTKDNMNQEYLRLNKKYYGDAVVSDEQIQYEWARIPHFYRAFYVYKYSTGIISALAIAERILTKGQEAVDDYFKFLSSGCMDSPVELLKLAGVNLEDKKTFEDAFKTFESVLNEFISLG